MFKKLGLTLLKLLPISTLLKFLLSLFKEYVKDTPRKWDDAIYELLNNLIDQLKFKNGKVEPNIELTNFYNTITEKIKKFDVSDTIEDIIDYLHMKARETEDTEFDDDLVDTIEALLIDLKAIKKK